MKRYIILSIVGLLTFGSLIFFYQRSESHLNKTHQDVLKMFLTAKQVDTALEKDLLKSRSFFLLNYDPIVDNENEVEQICPRLKGPEFAIYNSLAKPLDVAIDEYCASLDSKLDKIENFKSKNAILRNSIYYLQKLSYEEFGDKGHGGAAGVQKKIQSDLIKLSLAYLLVSTAETHEAFYQVILKAKSHAKVDSGNLMSIASHASRIYELKDVLDLLTTEIVNSNTSDLLENVRQQYFNSYSKEESTAGVYRQLLFGACVLFLIFVIYNILQIWKSAQQLSEANSNLEQRVLERTKELKESQETIIQQQQVLVASAKMSSLGEMAGGIAHEINTPLAIIGMRVEQLEECMMEDDVVKEDFLRGLNVIKVTTNRIAKIISGLKFFARDGKVMPTSFVPLVSIVEETLSFCRERFGNHGIQLEVENKCDESLEIDCRSVEISQVVLNLLNNAYDAIESTKDEKWVRLSLSDLGKAIEIKVTDSGLGISKELQEKIMQPFFTTKDVGKGTGLGLSISRGIIQSHHGDFYLNMESKNTCFVIVLPKRQPANAYKEVI